MDNKKVKIVAYDVYDRNHKWMTSYSVELLNGDPFEMARTTVQHHAGGYIKARCSDGTDKKVFP